MKAQHILSVCLVAGWLLLMNLFTLEAQPVLQSGTTTPPTAPVEDTPRFRAGELILKLRKEALMHIQKDGSIRYTSAEQLMQQPGFRELIPHLKISRVFRASRLKHPNMLPFFRVQFDAEVALETAETALQALEMIERVERIPIFALSSTPNDPRLAELWHLERIEAQAAWTIQPGSQDVVVAIVDDAVLTTHEDLRDKVVPGWDVADNDADPNPPTFSYSHGTHCAGIAAGATNNGVGIASIGNQVRILPIKATSRPRVITHAYEGVEEAIARQVDVMSLSWGGGYYSDYAQELFRVAHQEGIVVLTSAGNRNSNQEQYPAAYDYVIAVGATDAQDRKAGFSSYGDYVDLMAPGVDILSPVHDNIPNASYAFKNGTSMACPMAAGLAALVLSQNPDYSPVQVEHCLEQGCDPIDSLNTQFAGQLGAGRINALATVSCRSSEVPGCQGDPFEDNNAPHLAKPLEGVARGLICPAGDQDFFRFELAQTGEVIIRLNRLEADYDLILYSPEGRQIAFSVQAGRAEERIRLSGLAPGTYTVKVWGFAGAWHGLAPYRLELNVETTCLADANEPNDQQSEAAVIRNSAEGVICPATDKDWFRYEHTQGSILKADLSRLPEDYDLEVYNENGVRLEGSYNQYLANEQIVLLDAAPGTYFFRIFGYNNAFMPTGRYLFEVESQGVCDDDSFEQNNTFSQATRLRPGGLEAFICPAGDVDWYRFDVDHPNSRLKLSLTNLQSDHDLYLYDANRSLVAYSYLGGGADELIELDSLNTGTYYVMIFGYGGAVSMGQPYLLELELEHGPICQTPSDLHIVNLGAPHAPRLYWSASEGAQAYGIVYRKIPAEGPWSGFMVEDTQIQLDNLLPGLCYHVHLFAYCAGNITSPDYVSDTLCIEDRQASRQSAQAMEENLESQAGIQVYPNPVREFTTVAFQTAQQQPVTIRIINLTGAVVLNRQFEAVPGNNEFRLDFHAARLTPGIYVLTLEDAHKRHTQKIRVE